MRKRYRIVSMIVIISLIGCLGCHKSPQFPKPPKGIPENDSMYCYGWGISDKSQENALENARVDFAARLKTDIHAEQWIEIIETTGNFSKRTEEKVYQFVESSIPEHNYEYYKDGDLYYALVKVRRKVLEASIKDDQKLVRDAYKNAQKSAKQGKLTQAIREYINALSSAEKLLTGDKNRVDMDGDGELELATTHIKNELSSYLDHIRIDKVGGDSQIGEIGSKLTQPFAISVYCTLWGRTPVIVSIRFSYQNGTGILELPSGERSESVVGTTNSQGNLECFVVSIDSITDRNAVVAQPDLLHFLNTLDTSLLDVDQYIKPLNEKKAIFTYRSKFIKEGDSSLILKLNGSASNQSFEDGEKVTLEVMSSNFRFVHLFHVSSLGEIQYIDTADLHKESAGNWKVKRKDPGGVLTIENITLGKKRAIETEAFVAIAAPIDLGFSKNKKFEKDQLLRTLKDKAGDQWSIGQISYGIK